MIFGRLLPYAILVIALLCTALAIMYHLWDEADERADLYEDKYLLQGIVAKITKEYVHDIQYLPAPDHVIADRAQRMCQQLLRQDRSDGDGAAETDPADRVDSHRLGQELEACWANTRQLRACQDEARAAGCAD